MNEETKNESGQLQSPTQLLELLEATIPFESVVHAFGYGSGVLAQTSTADATVASNRHDSNSNSSNVHFSVPRIDFIVIVRDALAFHTANARRNPSHYPTLPFWCAPSPERTASVAHWIQRGHGMTTTTTTTTSTTDTLSPSRWSKRRIGGWSNPGLYFCVTDALKYGIVQVQDATHDCEQWSHLYLAGRWHKPVVSIYETDQADDQESLERLWTAQRNHNLPAALATALLLDWTERHRHVVHHHHHQQRDETAHPPHHGVASAVNVFQRVASLSYTGDPRVTYAAEDPHKVQKLVTGTPGQLSRFQTVYKPALSTLVQEGILSVTTPSDNPMDVHYSWDDTNPLAHARLWQSLPVAVRQCHGPPVVNGSMSSSLVEATTAAQNLPQAIASIVAPAARYQSFKGLWTAGFGTSATYIMQKLSKGLLRKRP